MLRFSLSGVHVPHRKNTANTPAQIMPAPSIVTIPMQQHIGAPSVPCVKVGDNVTVGQVIAEPGGYVGTFMHASVSGVVKSIDTVGLTNGAFCPAVVIASDGEMTQCPDIAPIKVESYDDFIAAVRNSGAVGFGGAGFPTSVKLDVKDTSRIDTILINGAECEPYITSDTYTMVNDADSIASGLEMLNRFLDAKRIIIGIEKNKPQCISALREATKDMPYVSVKALSAVYPQGGEKVLIYNILKRIVPEGKLPIDVGVVVLNCTTLAAIAKYISTGMPIVSKCITVDGSAIAEPKNVIVPIGTSIDDVIAFCGGYKTEPKKILYGGPMMGITVNDSSMPILKNNNAILAFDEKDATEPKTTPCIRCGKCVSQCPLALNPVLISKAYRNNDTAALADLKVNLCMECGCCSYTCPTKQPLVQRNKLAKVMLRNSKAKEAAK
ncbi:MAG: electron transport complex subunit RsxC [Clostridia bacterium]|nr:electron transport complex subunit RsxC [Clostridia bacterium]